MSVFSNILHYFIILFNLFRCRSRAQNYEEELLLQKVGRDHVDVLQINPQRDLHHEELEIEVIVAPNVVEFLGLTLRVPLQLMPLHAELLARRLELLLLTLVVKMMDQ